jgi:hypothetical protein
MAAPEAPKSMESLLLAELVALGQDQLRWHRAAVLPQVRETVEKALNSTKVREAYELCDGTKTGQEIAKAVGTSQASFSGWNKRWRDLGIAYEDGGKVKHLASLKSLGLPLKLDD